MLQLYRIETPVADCKGKATRANCNRRHHISIRNKVSNPLLTAPMSNEAVVYPVVIVEMQGMKCRALVDTGAGSSYASAGLLNCIKAEPIKSNVLNIEMLLGTTTRKLDTFHIDIKAVDGDFCLMVRKNSFQYILFWVLVNTQKLRYPQDRRLAHQESQWQSLRSWDGS